MLLNNKLKYSIAKIYVICSLYFKWVMFFIKSLCVLFISILIGLCVRAAEKKTIYCLSLAKNQTIEITKEEYVSILNNNDLREKDEFINVWKRESYSNKDAIKYGFLSFTFLLTLVSLFELWKRKNSVR